MWDDKDDTKSPQPKSLKLITSGSVYYRDLIFFDYTITFLEIQNPQKYHITFSLLDNSFNNIFHFNKSTLDSTKTSTISVNDYVIDLDSITKDKFIEELRKPPPYTENTTPKFIESIAKTKFLLIYGNVLNSFCKNNNFKSIKDIFDKFGSGTIIS